MTALPLVFIAGILGSSHCIGMCGPFALTIGSGAGNWKTNFGRQAIYSVGRIFTYAVFGAVAGAAGLYLHQNIPSLVNVAALLAIVSGLFLLYQGLLAARLIRRRLAERVRSALPGRRLLRDVPEIARTAQRLPGRTVHGDVALRLGLRLRRAGREHRRLARGIRRHDRLRPRYHADHDAHRLRSFTIKSGGSQEHLSRCSMVRHLDGARLDRPRSRIRRNPGMVCGERLSDVRLSCEVFW